MHSVCSAVMEFSELPEWARQATAECADRLSRDGCLRVELSLTAREEGGIRHHLLSGWTVGRDVEPGRSGVRPDFDATVVPEGDVAITPGNSAVVRLFPRFPGRWSEVLPGATIGMLDGGRRVGTAVVTEKVELTNAHLIGRWPAYTSVRFRVDHDGVTAGTEGCIVEVYSDGYEVEVVGPDGKTLWLGGVADDRLEWRG